MLLIVNISNGRFISQVLYSPALLPGNQLLAIATSVVASATKSVFAQENLMLIESGLAELEVVQSEGERGGKRIAENY